MQYKLLKNKYGKCGYGFEYGGAFIYGLLIKKKYRKQGHGKNILTKAINKIRKTGYSGIIDVVVRSNENWLTEFYTRMGLEVFNET